MTQKIIPLIWLRLAVLVGFSIFVAAQDMWIVTAIAIVLTLITVAQLVIVYRNR